MPQKVMTTRSRMEAWALQKRTTSKEPISAHVNSSTVSIISERKFLGSCSDCVAFSRFASGPEVMPTRKGNPDVSLFPHALRWHHPIAYLSLTHAQYAFAENPHNAQRSIRYLTLDPYDLSPE